MDPNRQNGTHSTAQPRAHLTAGRLPPDDPNAERSVLGALLGPSTHDAYQLLDPYLTPGTFRTPKHANIAAAAHTVKERGERVDPITVAHQLRRDGLLDQIGGTSELIGLVADGSPPTTALSHARILADLHRRWKAYAAAYQLADAAVTGDDLTPAVDQVLEAHADTHHQQQAVGAGTFIYDHPQDVVPLWGDHDDILWAADEPLLIVGPTGIGKTTVAQHLTLARAGLTDKVLGFPVHPDERRILYIAADRPAQARRSLARMVTEADRDLLDQRITIWPGPLPDDITHNRRCLLDLADRHQAGTIIVDSLKDVAADLSKDETGVRVNQTFQATVAAGVQVVGLHHQRKQGQTPATKPTALVDVYGSTWITAGAGSVLLVWGEPGEPVAELTHLKAPAGHVDPLMLTFDQVAGQVEAERRPTPLRVLADAHKGITAQGLAQILYADMGRTHTEKARRSLEQLARAGKAHKQEGDRERGGRTPAVYYPVDTRHEEEF